MFVFSVVIPTTGRPTLARTLESVDRRLADVIVVADTHGPLESDVEAVAREYDVRYLEFDAGVHDTGSPQLHVGNQYASGAWLLNCGDDDVYVPGAFEAMYGHIARGVQHPLMFRTILHPSPGRANTVPVVLWSERQVERFNVTGQGFACPNSRTRLGRWVDDVTFMRETVALHGGAIDWCDEITMECY